MIRWLAGWKGYAVAGLLAAAAGWTLNGWRMDAKLARAESEYALVLEQLAQATTAAVQAARAEEARRMAAVEEQRDIAIEQNETLAADVAAGRTVSERLRTELNALRARHAGRDTALAERGQSQPGTDPIGLLIELHAGLDEAGREVAEYADRLRIAGMVCERGYDEVRKAQ